MRPEWASSTDINKPPVSSSAVVTVSEETSNLPPPNSLLCAGVAGCAEGEDGAGTGTAQAHHWPVNFSTVIRNWPYTRLRSLIFVSYFLFYNAYRRQHSARVVNRPASRTRTMGNDSSKCLPECVRKLPIGGYIASTSTGLLFGLAFEKSQDVGGTTDMEDYSVSMPRSRASLKAKKPSLVSSDSVADELAGERNTPLTAVAVVKYFLCLSTGAIFGMAFHKARVIDPSVIRDQMLLRDFTFLKFFLSALGASIVSMSLLSALPATRQRFLTTYDKVAVKQTAKSTSAAVVGGLISGAGITIAGSCPVTIFSQIGSQVPNIGYTFLGGLAGTLFYGLFKPAFDNIMQAVRTDAVNKWRKTSFFMCALPVAATLGAVVFGLELYSPWADSRGFQAFEMIAKKSWPPYCAGAMLGLLQIPLVYFINQPLGGSTSLLCMLAQGFVGPLKGVSPFIAKFRTGFTYWWQVFFVSGAMVGSYLSASSSQTLGSVLGVTPTQAFTGGALMFLGARIAGGCTSGHGFSGCALMSPLSATMVTSMFGGAVTTAMFMQKQGLL
ncbi:hypothetical protein LSAT2_007376 [Lamellibrachia satsuma]|nr:hypothetical protein LSAT2_007376 [Lamellibrachia satsuma]